MSAREALIRAYAFHTLKPSSGGDFDLGARGTHDPVRRRAKLIKFDDIRYSSDPVHAKQSKQKSINTTQIIMNGLIAGKIISAAEGRKKYQGAYSRVYYSDSPRKADNAILGAYLTKRLLDTQKGTGKLLGASEIILAYCANRPTPHKFDSDIKNDLDRIINYLDRGLTIRVGLVLKKLTTP